MARSILADIDRLRRHVEPHVRRARKVIVAFGSVARGDADEWSDLDLIIVAETARPFFERFKDFRGLYDVWPRLDLLIYTPAEFEQMLADENPLIAAAVAEVGLREGFLACFVCQQAGEKALKALCYLRGDRVVLGHSLVELLASVADREAVVPEIREGTQQLDQYYVPTRYPNALPGGVPAEVFTRRQAEEAVAIARRIVAFARAAIGP